MKRLLTLLTILICSSCNNPSSNKTSTTIKKDTTENIINKLPNKQLLIDSFVYSIPLLSQNLTEIQKKEALHKSNKNLKSEIFKISGAYNKLDSFIVNVKDVHTEKTMDGSQHLVFNATNTNSKKIEYWMHKSYYSEDIMYKDPIYKYVSTLRKGEQKLSFLLVNIDIATDEHSWYNMTLYNMSLAPKGTVKLIIAPINKSISKNSIYKFGEFIED